MPLKTTIKTLLIILAIFHIASGMVTLITIFLFLLTALSTSVFALCNYRTATPYFQRSVYEFTLKLVKKINQETGSHFVTSALSPWTLLTALSLGASDTTLQELQEVLQLNPHSNCFVYLYLELVNQVTMKPNNPASSILERSSTIFFNASLNVKQSFFDDLSLGGFCNSRIMYFVDSNQTARSINAHVQSYTDNAIDKMVAPNDLVGISTITIDAMSFRGAWKVPFPYEDTATDAFYDEEGQQIGDVSLMYLCGSFNVTTVPDIQATVLELPYYGYEHNYSMLLFLPKSNVSLTTMLDLMDTINISSIFNLYDRTSPTTITVQIPRFKISSNFEKWKELLMGMGINTIFKEQEADDPGRFYYQLFLTNFIQKAELEVSEEGMEDGRPTVSLMDSRFMYDQFVAKKPFMFMIVDRGLDVPIFTGAYSKPSIYR